METNMDRLKTEWWDLISFKVAGADIADGV